MLQQNIETGPHNSIRYLARGLELQLPGVLGNHSAELWEMTLPCGVGSQMDATSPVMTNARKLQLALMVSSGHVSVGREMHCFAGRKINLLKLHILCIFFPMY